jgi:hypothetical protein
MPDKRSILLITEGQRAEPALVRRALAAYGFDAAYEIVPYGANIHDLYARIFADGQDDSVELFAAEDAVDVLSTCLFFICDYNPNLIDFKRVL